jgi:hypothetical protein
MAGYVWISANEKNVNISSMMEDAKPEILSERYCKVTFWDLTVYLSDIHYVLRPTRAPRRGAMTGSTQP